MKISFIISATSECSWRLNDELKLENVLCVHAARMKIRLQSLMLQFTFFCLGLKESFAWEREGERSLFNWCGKIFRNSRNLNSKHNFPSSFFYQLKNFILWIFFSHSLLYPSSIYWNGKLMWRKFFMSYAVVD